MDEELYQPYIDDNSDFSDSVPEHQVNEYATEENVQYMNSTPISTPISTSISQSPLSHLSTPAMLTMILLQ